MNWQNLPPHSRVWIYQADRKLNQEELTFIREKANAFVSNWSSHGTALEAAIDVFHDLFVVVFVNEQQAMASGCSIDKSVGLIREFEKELKIDFMNRMLAAVRKNDELELIHLHKLPEQIKSGLLSVNTIVFNNLITTKEEFEKSWTLKIEESWHKNFIN